MASEHSGTLFVTCDLLDQSLVPNGLMNYNNPIMTDLPRPKHVSIDQVLVELGGPPSDTEKRILMGEHNGAKFIKKPVAAIMDATTSELTTVLRTAGVLKLSVYLKMKIELEEIVWNEQGTATKKLLYSGYVHVHSRKKHGKREILLTKKTPSEYDATALAIFSIEGERDREKRLSGQVLKPQIQPTVMPPSIVAKQRSETSRGPFAVNLDFRSVHSMGCVLPAISIGVFTSSMVTRQLRLPSITQTGQTSMKVSGTIGFTCELDELKNVELFVVHGSSGWTVASGVLELVPLMVEQSLITKLVKNAEFGELCSIDAIEVIVSTKRTILKSGTFLTPPSRLSQTAPLPPVSQELSITQKMQKLQERHKLLTLSEPALAEKMRLIKVASVESGVRHKEHQIEKEKTIFNCLIDAVTEVVHLLSTCASLSQIELPIDNFSDSPLQLTIEQALPKHYTVKKQRGIVINERRRVEIVVNPGEQIKLVLQLRPITPGQLDDVIDLLTKNGTVFKRYRLVGSIQAPYAFERVNLIEREHSKMCKSIPLATFPNSTIIYDFGKDRDRFSLVARELNRVEIRGTTGGTGKTYIGWLHIVIDDVVFTSMLIQIDIAKVVHYQLREGASTWVGLFNLPLDRPLELHYSRPNDFNFGDGGVEESLRLVDDHHQICLYGFEPGSFRRHMRIFDSHGVMLDQFLVLLEIEPIRISRSYDIQLNDRPGRRRIEITNPYEEEKLFKLHSR